MLLFKSIFGNLCWDQRPHFSPPKGYQEVFEKASTTLTQLNLTYRVFGKGNFKFWKNENFEEEVKFLDIDDHVKESEEICKRLV